MSSITPTWNDETLEKLAELITKTDKSYGKMLADLQSLKPELTRSAVIGQIDRFKKGTSPLNDYLTGKPELLAEVRRGIRERSSVSIEFQTATHKPHKPRANRSANKEKTFKKPKQKKPGSVWARSTGETIAPQKPIYAIQSIDPKSGVSGEAHKPSMCQWPLGEHRDAHGHIRTIFCSNAQSPVAGPIGKAYCEHHMLKSVTPASRDLLSQRIAIATEAAKLTAIANAENTQRLTMG